MNTTTTLQTKYKNIFLVMMGLYALLVFILIGTGAEKFEHLHLELDISNAILSLLLAVFLLGERHEIQSNVRSYLVIAFGFAAATEFIHAMIGVEWTGSLAWVQEYSTILRPATWPPSTYVLPLAMAWSYWLMRRKAPFPPMLFGLGLLLLTIGLTALSLYLPRYIDTGILGIQRPTQVPLLFIWGGVIYVYWQQRRMHRLFGGLALMGAMLFISDLFMLYSTSPHEKFTMIAHAGKLIAYSFLHLIQMRIAADDALARDIAESALIEEKEQLRKTLEELRYQKFALDQHAIVSTTDVNGNITYVNDRLCEVSGYTREQLMGNNHRLLNSGTHPKDYFGDMYHTIKSGKVWHGEICNRNKSGNICWMDTTIVPFMDDNGKPTQYISMRTDVTARKLSEAQIFNLAFYDPLTKLPNRRLLNDRLGQALAASKRSGFCGALMFLDLDNFKPLNDEYGHAVGDLLLQEVAKRLMQCVREADTIARFGGDEFIVMLGELSSFKSEASAQAIFIAEKIRQALSEPYYLIYSPSDTSEKLTVEHRCTSSIGMTLFKGDGSSSEDILKRADAAMYQAKESGRNTIHTVE